MKRIFLFTAVILVVVALPLASRTRAITPSSSFETDIGCLDPNVRKPQTISLGRIDSRVIEIPKPIYPADAKDAKISGVVTEQGVVDETGKGIRAPLRTGHSLLPA